MKSDLELVLFQGVGVLGSYRVSTETFTEANNGMLRSGYVPPPSCIIIKVLLFM